MRLLQANSGSSPSARDAVRRDDEEALTAAIIRLDLTSMADMVYAGLDDHRSVTCRSFRGRHGSARIKAAVKG